MRWYTPQEQQAAQASHHGLGEGERAEALLWEAALGALLAAGELPRRQWLDRALEVAPGVSRDEARALLSELERQGDVTVAAGGVIAAAPLRAVPLGDGAALLVGTLPSRRLSALLGQPVLRRGALRRVARFGAPEQAALEGLGGAVVGLDQWSKGPDAPRADDALLDRWSKALWSGSRAPGEASLWAPGAAKRWVAGGGWRAWEGAPAAPWSLARVDLGPQRWLAWLVAQEGEQWVTLPLQMDEARRLTFALDLAADAAGALRGEPLEGGARWALWAPRLLPVAEYRMLLASAEEIRRGEGLPRAVLPVERARALARALEERLGLSAPEGLLEG